MTHNEIHLHYRNSSGDLKNVPEKFATFVGLRVDDGEAHVYFPYGFKAVKSKSDEALLRKDVLLLLQTICKAKTKASFANADLKSEVEKFPLQAYLFVLQDYFLRGYYKERRSFFKVADSGKIHWGRTIKQIKPEFFEDSAIYLKFMVKQNSLEESEILGQIHRHCVKAAKENLGFLFPNFFAEESRIPLNDNTKKLFSAVLRSKLSKTFNDSEKFLFYNMLCIVESLDYSGKNHTLEFGTYEFDNVWEQMIDSVFGIADKSAFFPDCTWNVGKESWPTKTLRPDTIMDLSSGIFVLDAKCYRYGITHDKDHLPAAESILKQIAYAEHIEENFEEIKGGLLNQDANKIYNAFLLPYCAPDSQTAAGEQCFFATYAATATASWKKSKNKNYEKIHAILLDTKSLMQNYAKSEIAQQMLADIIYKKCEMATGLSV